MRSTIIYSTLLAIFSVSVLAQQVNHHDHAGRSLEINFIHAERDLMIDSPQRLDESSSELITRSPKLDFKKVKKAKGEKEGKFEARIKAVLKEKTAKKKEAAAAPAIIPADAEIVARSPKLKAEKGKAEKAKIEAFLKKLKAKKDAAKAKKAAEVAATPELVARNFHDRIAAFLTAKAAREAARASVANVASLAEATATQNADSAQITESADLSANAAQDQVAKAQIALAEASELSASPPSPTQLAQISQAELIAAESTISVGRAVSLS